MNALRKQVQFGCESVRSVELSRSLPPAHRRVVPTQLVHPRQTGFDEVQVERQELSLILRVRKVSPMKHSTLQKLVLHEPNAYSNFLHTKFRGAGSSFQRVCHGENRTTVYLVPSSFGVSGLKPKGVKQPAPKRTRRTVGNRDHLL